jgi:ABC-2 type transport system permease protein/lipopolysaccharide transport system permease protein
LQATVIERKSGNSWPYLLKGGWWDLADGFSRREAWTFLAWHEIRRQYERSVLGPFWITLNIGMMITAIGWFYSEIFGQKMDDYLPYLTLGFIVFGFMSGTITEASNVFANEATSIKQSLLPMTFYVYKLIFRQIIIFAHNITIFLLVWIVFPLPFNMNLLLAIPGFVLMVLTGFFAALIVGPMSARFRDIPPIIASVVQIFFFITPIFWGVENVPKRGVFVNINPFYHYLEVVRQPLLGRLPTDLNWLAVSVITVVLGLFAFVFFSRYRAQVAYWV